MAEIVYVLCAIMSVVCATLLLRAYFRGRSALLLWSSLCFGFFALNNVILFVDMMVLPDVEFGGLMMRTAAGAIAGTLLLFGLIWELT